MTHVRQEAALGLGRLAGRLQRLGKLGVLATQLLGVLLQPALRLLALGDVAGDALDAKGTAVFEGEPAGYFQLDPAAGQSVSPDAHAGQHPSQQFPGAAGVFRHQQRRHVHCQQLLPGIAAHALGRLVDGRELAFEIG